MSETVETQTTSKPWLWPGEWMKDEKFWRDVASRTLSGLFVVLLGYAAAIWLGYVKTPEGFNVSQAVVQGIFVLLTSFILFKTYKPTQIAAHMTKNDTPRWQAWGVTLIALMSMILLIGILGGALINGAFQLIRPLFESN